MNIQVEYQGRTLLIQELPQSLANLKLLIESATGLPTEQQSLFLNSRFLQQQSFSTAELQNSTIRLRLGLVGGKGGFGAKMKNEGSKKNRGNNTKFSRDLTGKRLDYANVRKDCIDYYKKKIEEDKIVEEERKKYKILESTILQENKSGRIDKKHKEELEEKANDIIESIKIGLSNKSRQKEEKVQDGDNNRDERGSQEQQKGGNEAGATAAKKQEQDEESKAGQGKRKLPKGEPEEQKNREPEKKVKLSQPQQKPEQKSQEKMAEKPKVVFASAADKLKSLFRK